MDLRCAAPTAQNPPLPLPSPSQVFSSKASQLRAIISEKVGRLQQSISLLPKNALQSPGSTSSDAPITRPPSLKDFSLLRCLGTGGFAEVWLASKRSTGDVFAIKAIRRGGQVTLAQSIAAAPCGRGCTSTAAAPRGRDYRRTTRA